MIANSTSVSEADILAQVVSPDDPSLERELARAVLDLRFQDEAQARIRELLDKNNRGTISESERGLLDKYLRVGQFIDLLQAKARLTLRQAAGGT
jgi:hypothetical protein